MSRHVDINGKISSKRYWGGMFLGLAFYMAIFFTLVWGIAVLLNKEIEFPDFLKFLWGGVVGAGTTKIVSTVFEKPSK